MALHPHVVAGRLPAVLPWRAASGLGAGGDSGSSTQTPINVVYHEEDFSCRSNWKAEGDTFSFFSVAHSTVFRGPNLL